VIVSDPISHKWNADDGFLAWARPCLITFTAVLSCHGTEIALCFNFGVIVTEPFRADPLKCFLSTWKSKRIQGTYRKFEEDQDADFVRMRMVVIWEAQETMERGVAERDHPSGFLT
jgi:hypothetical protein